MKVLVTDGDEQTLAIMRYLSKQGINVSVISHTRRAVSFYSKYCRKRFMGPPPGKEREYVESLLGALKKDQYDLLMPVGFQSNYIISKNRKEIEKYVKLEIADHESLSIALNKKRTYELAEKVGVPFPPAIYPQQLKEVEQLATSLSYPVVIKGLSEAGGKTLKYPSNPEELVHMYSQVCQQNGLTEDQGNLPMIQEYVRGDITYSLSAFYQKGVCKRIYMFKEVRSIPVTGGSASYAESLYNPILKDYSIKLLNALNWHGVAHVEFKQEKASGNLKLMEINPKFWASVDVALRAGVNFPYFLYESAKGIDLPYSEECDRNLRFHFPLSRELNHFLANPKSFPKIFMDCFSPRVKSNIWLNDPLPNVVELMNNILAIIYSWLPVWIRRRIKGIVTRQ